MTKGSNQIRVAVIDDGVEAHEDLEDASGNSRVLNGFTPQTGGNGRPTFDQRTRPDGTVETAGHGVACAGIIAATHNNKGVRGVAPNVKIVPVNVFDGGESPAEFAEGINWAWDEGNADVLSNSWGYPPAADFDVIADAIQDARTQGRGGKGSVVVFAAGNFPNGSQVTDASFPSDVAGVLGVGAVDRDDDRWYYTPSAGSDIDIVAPSGDIRQQGDVRTTDRMGALGYERSSGDNYTPRFGGTSAAAPQAAGVAALILSENSGLTESQVRSRIEVHADDYGNTNWDGEGRLNASGAVYSVLPLAAPQNLRVTNRGEVYTGARLAWDATANATGYRIYRKERQYGPWTQVGSTGQTTYTTNVILQPPGTSGVDEYHFHVKATNPARLSNQSNEVSVNGKDISPQPSDLHAGAAAAEALPEEFALKGSTPNPFRGQTKIRYALPEAAEVELAVYDVLGREVARPVDRRMSPGFHEAPFEAEGLPSGVYVYRLRAGGFAGSGRMVLVK